jgi:hypothetical protein
VILIVSRSGDDGHLPHADRHSISVPVLISLFSTIANVLLGYNFTTGMAVHFWWHASHGAKVRITNPCTPARHGRLGAFQQDLAL